MKETKYDVFISYSSKDQKVAEGVCAYLEQRKIRCFVAYRDIPQGKVWARAIVEALEVSSMMVVIFSKNFNVSEQVDREIELTAEDRKPILTFRLSDDDFQGAKKYYLKNLNWIDAFPNPDACFGKLSEGVLRLLGRPVEVRREPAEVPARVDKGQPRQRPLAAPAPHPPKQWKAFFKNNRKWFFLGLAIVGVVLLAIVLWPKHNGEGAIMDTVEIVDTMKVVLDQKAEPAVVTPIVEQVSVPAPTPASSSLSSKKEVPSLPTAVTPDADQSGAPTPTPSKPSTSSKKEVPTGYTDLGLPSGTMWKSSNQAGFYTYDEAVLLFGESLPTREQCQELKEQCQWTWSDNGYKVTGPNGNTIFLPAGGWRDSFGYVLSGVGYYWTSTPNGSKCAFRFGYSRVAGSVDIHSLDRSFGYSVRLVKN